MRILRRWPALVTGVWAGFLWGVVMFFAAPSNGPDPGQRILILAAVSTPYGVMFGIRARVRERRTFNAQPRLTGAERADVLEMISQCRPSEDPRRQRAALNLAAARVKTPRPVVIAILIGVLLFAMAVLAFMPTASPWTADGVLAVSAGIAYWSAWRHRRAAAAFIAASPPDPPAEAWFPWGTGASSAPPA